MIGTTANAFEDDLAVVVILSPRRSAAEEDVLKFTGTHSHAWRPAKACPNYPAAMAAIGFYDKAQRHVAD
jgi:hypothetical protein